MKITFIVPSIGGFRHGGRSIKSWRMEPLEMAVLAGLTPKDVEKELYDDRIEQINFETKTDLVAISVQTFNAKRAYHVAERFRRRGIPVVMGGYHATLMPDEVKFHCDAIVVGDAESVWAKVMEDARNGNLMSKYQGMEGSNLGGTFPDRSIFRGKKYLDLQLMETGRGCKFVCNFCSITAFHKNVFKPRPIEDIVHEIQITGAKRIFFVDDNIVSDQTRAKELFRALVPLNIRWFGQGSIDMARDNELLDLMKQSGCVGILVGFESISKKSLLQMHKSQNLSVNLQEAAQKLHHRKIRIYATFIFGYDDDVPESLEQTYRFILHNKFFMVAMNHLVPFPGTPLYEQLRQEGRLVSDDWWMNDNYLMGDVVFNPKQMSAEQLKDLCFRYRKKAYSIRSIAVRFFNWHTNFYNLWVLFLYFSINLMMRVDVNKRQGLAIAKENILVKQI